MLGLAKRNRMFCYAILGSVLLTASFWIPSSSKRHSGFVYSGTTFVLTAIVLIAEMYYRTGGRRWLLGLVGLNTQPSNLSTDYKSVGPSGFYGGLGGFMGALVAGPLLASAYITYNSRPNNPDPEPAFMHCGSSESVIWCPRFYLIIVFVTIIATVYGFHLGQRLHFGCKKQRERAGENTAMLSSGKYRLQRLYYCIQPALWTAVWIGIPVGVIANFFGGSAPPFYDMAIAATNAVIFVSFCILGAFARWQSRRVFSMVEIDLVIIAISFLLALDNMRSFFEPLTRKIDAVSNLLDYNVYTFHITWWWVLYFLLSIPVSLILAVFIALVLTAVIAIDAMSATPTSMYFSED